MIGTLPNVMNSFSRSSKTTVQSLIRDMKVDKSELQKVINRMSSYAGASVFSAARISPFSILDRQILVELFRESFLKIQNYFTAVNSVGLALNSMVNVLSAEIDKAQKDIQNLELFINSYEFTSGKDDLYNFNYIEKFSDFLSDYRHDGSSFLIPDRDNSTFPVGGNGFIDSDVGIFKFGTSTKIVNVINKILSVDIQSNYANYITSNSDATNLFNDNLLDSWNVTVKSPTILTSALSNYLSYFPYDVSPYNGAQTIVDMSFTEGIMMDTIRFSPNAGNDFLLMQVIIFSNIDDPGKAILSEPSSLLKLKEFSFPKQLVSRVVFIFNQSSYTRSKAVPIISELNSKAVNAFVQERVNERRGRFSVYQDMVHWFFGKRTKISELSKKKSEYDFYSSRFPLEFDSFNKLISEEIFINSNFGIDFKYEINKSPAFINLIQNAFMAITKESNLIKSTSFIEGYGNVTQRLLDSAGFLYSGKSSDYYNLKDQFYNYPIISGGVESTIQSLLINESSDSYEYSFSLKSIEFIETISSEVQKACFVSQKIPVNGQVTALKAKIGSLENAAVSDLSDYDLKSLVSYELSVSTLEAPVKEDDWYPLVFNDTTTVESEVVFFDISDYSTKLRFRPIIDSIFLYKDGKSISEFRYTPVSNTLYLTDPSLYSPANTFCVRYDLDLVQYSPQEIDFIKQNIFNDSVRTYGDTSGMGQQFRRTDSNRSVTLEYVPYVNQTLSKGSSYSVTNGTIFFGDTTGYSPVKVRLQDGTFATNLTNYTGKPQNVQFYPSDTLAFIQSGKNIVFNQSLNSSFRILYDYVPNNLRFRFIIRKNIPSVNIPVKVDNILLKMKTINFDSYYDKLILSTVGK